MGAIAAADNQGTDKINGDLRASDRDNMSSKGPRDESPRRDRGRSHGHFGRGSIRVGPILALDVGMSPTCLTCSLSLGLLTMAACSSGRPDGGPDGGESASDAAPFTQGVSTLTGAAEAAYWDGDRASARFDDPVNAIWGPDGRLYVADFNNSKIRVVDTLGTTDTIVAQNNFIRPYGLVFLGDGTLVVETDVDPTGADNLQSGTLWTVDLAAHTATVLAADLGRPRGLALLPSGLVAMADEFHHTIRTLDPSSGDIVVIAGLADLAGTADGVGANARFSTPYGLAVRPDGSLVVCDFGNSRLRVVALDGTVTTLVGGAPGFRDGAAGTAQFDQPQAITSNAAGDLFVTDTGNLRIRMLSGSEVTTIAGDGTSGYLDAADPTAASLYGLEGVTLNKAGSVVYFTDGSRGTLAPYNRVRQVQL